MNTQEQEQQKFQTWLARVREESEEVATFTHEELIQIFCHGLGHKLCQKVVSQIKY